MNRRHINWSLGIASNRWIGATLVALSAAAFASHSRARDVYISETGSTLEKWDGSSLSAFATLPSGQAEGIAVNALDDVFVASSTGNIYKYAGGNPANISTFATVPGGSLSGLTLDNSGNLFVVNRADDQVYKITSGGGVSQFTTGAPFSLPTGLAFTGGNLYVADTTAGTITQVNAFNANESPFASGVAAPYALAADNTSLYVSNSITTNQVLKYSLFGGTPTTLLIFGDSSTGGGLVTDGLGNLYVGKIGGFSGPQLDTVPVAGGAPTVLTNLTADPNFLAIQPVPEPGTLALVGASVLFLCMRTGALATCKRRSAV
jgi:hypothetical protein